MKKRTRRLIQLGVAIPLLGALGLIGCAPGGQQGGGTSGGSTAPSGPKVLRVGITADAEPKEGGIPFSSAAGGAEAPFLMHAGLTVFDEQGLLQPRLVQQLPTIENGDW